MIFNTISRLQNCFVSIQDIGLTSLVYYSHIPVALIALLLGWFIYVNNKKIAAKIILLLSITFATWSFIDIVLWTSLDSQKYVFFWSLTSILEVFIFILSIYFINVFALGRDVKMRIKIILSFFILPIFLFTSTSYNIAYFNMVECVPVNDLLYPSYVLPLIGALSILLIGNLFYLFKKIDKTRRYQLSLISISLIAFLVSFFGANYVGIYFIENNILSYIDSYKIEMYSLFVMPVFLGVLTFVIVRFKAFNIKLLGVQALVFALTILVAAQFLYKQQMPFSSQVLAGITLLFTIFLGLFIIRSVKKEITQRELLDIANRNQQSLLHFITHQVKGVMTKSRNIFDGILAGDYGEVSDKIKETARYGFESETKGVETVQAILKASDLKTGKTEFKKEKINLSLLVEDLAQKQKEVAKQKGLNFVSDIDKDIEVLADPIKIGEVFKNITDNSITYTNQGSISVSLHTDSRYVIFRVVDTGFGLTEEDKTKLFTEGGKGTDSLSVNINSTGYGLFIAKKIIEQHNGKIGALSNGRNKGSEFFVKIPKIQ